MSERIVIPDIPIGSAWRTGPWRETPRFIIVTDTQPGKHLIDKGPTAPYPQDEVSFTFADGQQSSCGASTFRRTYVREGAQ